MAVAAFALGGLVLATGSASAWGPTRIPLRNTGHGVGVYSQPTSASGKVSGDLSSQSGDVIYAMCWTVGESIGNQGDVWYETVEADYNGAFPNAAYFPAGAAWTFAPYVDGAAAFHSNLPQCPRSTG